ncbi:Conserved_hypothetical protein [Hexamita inflata]|uniref:Uncharacterized protein n=1 Tax=Hexamita inflata TaxID=28002 RepID=A0AA86UB33_9EUKA|nr:Conserved hypothetical protein [Hexamita inflata]
MVDISLSSLMMLEKTPKRVIKCGNFIIFHVDNEIIVTKLNGSALVFDNKIRLTSNSELIIPLNNSQTIYLLVSKQKLYQYNLLTQQYTLKLESQFDCVHQLSDTTVIQIKLIEEHDMVQLQSRDFSNASTSLKSQLPASDYILSKNLRNHIAVITQSKDSYQLSFFLVSDLTLVQQFSFTEKVVNIFEYNDLIYLVTADSLYKYEFQTEFKQIQKTPLLIQDVSSSIINGNELLIKNNQNQLQINLENLKQKVQQLQNEQLFILNQENDIFNFDSLELNQNQIEQQIQTTHQNIMCLDYLKAMKYIDKNDLLFMLPIVIYYDLQNQTLNLFDVIHFKKVFIKTPPIAQMCMACTQSHHLIAYSVFNEELNISTITIQIIDQTFECLWELHHFEVWDKVKCITLQHDMQTVCTAVTVQNCIYVQRIESREEYSFQAEFEVKCAFELTQPFNLYLLDEQNQGHFICVPSAHNINFSHIYETSDSVYKTFDYMLVMYTTQWPNEPIVLPKDVDVETSAFLHNMGKALNRDFEQLEHFASLEQQMRPTFQQNQLTYNPRVSFVFQHTAANKKAQNLKLKLHNYYIDHDDCFEVKLERLLQRLDLYVEEVQAQYSVAKQDQQHKDFDVTPGENKLPEIQFNMGVRTSVDIPRHNLHPENPDHVQRVHSNLDLKAYGMEPHVIDVNNSLHSNSTDNLSLSQSSIGFTKQALPRTYDHVTQKFDYPRYEELRTQVKNRDDLNIISHSVYQTISFSKFEPSQVLSFNLLSVFIEYRQTQTSEEAEFVLYQIVSRLVPLFSTIVLSDQGDLRNLLFQLFDCDKDFDFTQFVLSLDSETQCYLSKESYLFTIAFIVLFTLFASIVGFSKFRGQETTYVTFDIIEQSLARFMRQKKQILCLHTIAQYLHGTSMQTRYACFCLLRLYQKNVTWNCDSLTEYLNTVNLSIQDLINNVTDDISNTIPSHVVAIEALSHPLYLISVEIGQNQKKITPQQQKIVDQSQALIKDSVKALINELESINEYQLDVMIETDAPIITFLSMGLHSLAYNMFYLNAILQAQQHKQCKIENEIQINDCIKQLIQILLRCGMLMQNDNKRMFNFEQLTQFFLKSADQRVIITLLSELITRHQNIVCYKSLCEYFSFLRQNYPLFLSNFAVEILQLLLPVSQIIFKQYLHQQQAKPLLLTLMKVIQNVARSSDIVHHFVENHRSILYYPQNDQLMQYDFKSQQLSQFKFSSNLSLDLIKAAKLEKTRAFIAVSLRNRFIILNHDIFDDTVLSVIPIVFNEAEIYPVKDFPFKIQFNKAFVQTPQIYMTIEVVDGLIEIVFSQTQLFSASIYRLDFVEASKEKIEYGMYKLKKGEFDKTRFGKKPNVVCVVDGMMVKYLIGW